MLDPRRLEFHLTSVLAELDPNPNREGLSDTPKRVAKAWAEWCDGYGQDPAAVLRTFEDGASGYDALVIVHGVPIQSHCEHHLAPFEGTADIGYLPGNRIVGLSKLARVAEIFAHRLQVQERLTTEISDCIHNELDARATGVIIRARHTCMSSRGVRAHGTITTTSAMRGLLQNDASLRAEFMALCAEARKE